MDVGIKSYLMSRISDPDADTPDGISKCQEVISKGVWTDEGDFHFFCLFRTEARYRESFNSLLFLCNPYSGDDPMQICARDERGLDSALSPEYPQYVRTARFILKHSLTKNRISDSEGKRFLQSYKEIIAIFLSKVDNDRRHFMKYANAPVDVGFQYQEEMVVPHIGDPPSGDVLDALERLGDNEKNRVSTLKSPARAVLRLTFSEELRRLILTPILIPLKKDGAQGKYQILTRAALDKKKVNGDLPLVFLQYMAYHDKIRKPGSGGCDGMEPLNLFFFHPLAQLAFQLPPDSLFYSAGSKEPLLPVNALTIRHCRLAYTSVPGSSFYRPILILACDNGREITAGRNFQISVTPEGGVFLFLGGETGNEPLYFARPAQPGDFIDVFSFLEKIRFISPGSHQAVISALTPLAIGSISVEPLPLPRCFVRFRPIPLVKINSGNSALPGEKKIVMEFDYRTGLEKFRKIHPDKPLLNANSDPGYEKYCFQLLNSDPLLVPVLAYDSPGVGKEQKPPDFLFSDGDETRWLNQRGGFYREKGFRILHQDGDNFIEVTRSRIKLEISADGKWVEFTPYLETFSDDPLSASEPRMADWRSLGEAGGEMLRDVEGGRHLVSPEDREMLINLSRLAQPHRTGFRTPAGNFFLISQLYQPVMETIPQLRRALDVADRLKEFGKISEYQPSAAFNGQLRNYQLAGFRWLMFLHDYHLHGCLADDMGLGKTVQALALLQTLKSNGRLETSLLVVPVSAVSNWETEINRFAPELTVYRCLGGSRNPDPGEWKKYDILITSYATLRADIGNFQNFPFYYLILDESQNIKNPGSQTARAVKMLQARKRLALSGTPVENNTMELWSLMDFLEPGFLGSEEWFKSQWAVPLENNNDEFRAHTLRRMIYPFLLRRRKEEVEKELPEKIEITELLAMGEEQAQAYSRTARLYSRKISASIGEKGLLRSTFTILEGMLRLRQICLFPHLAGPDMDSVPSAKFEHFKDVMEDIILEGHKALVFSQFNGVLDMLARWLSEQRAGFVRLDGSVPAQQRKTRIVEFQENPHISVFLLSLKAGGVALNLTAADYVVIFDPWWNPAAEAQAVDRAHRIGQTKKVLVYRFIIRNSIEEKMRRLQERKKDLASQLIIPDENFLKKLSREEILDLFRFAP